MLISFSKSPPEVPHIIVHGSCLERVETTKLLCIQLSYDLTWGSHIEYILKKAQLKMCCLTMLKRSKVSNTDIVHIFCSKVRPILEFGAAIWHGGLTQEQENASEDIQMRACTIAMSDQEYHAALQHVGIPILAES